MLDVRLYSQNVTKWIMHLLVRDEMRLKDIPFEIRVTDDSIYTAAFRISSISSCVRFVQDLTVLCNDIYQLDFDPRHANFKNALLRVLSDQLCLNDHKGAEELGYFLESVPTKVLQQLRDYDGIRKDYLGEEFGKHGIAQ